MAEIRNSWTLNKVNIAMTFKMIIQSVLQLQPQIYNNINDGTRKINIQSKEWTPGANAK